MLASWPDKHTQFPELFQKWSFLSKLVHSADDRPASGEFLFLEAEGSSNQGGWKLEQQSMDQMGSPYLFAHGLGANYRGNYGNDTCPVSDFDGRNDQVPTMKRRQDTSALSRTGIHHRAHQERFSEIKYVADGPSDPWYGQQVT